MVDVVAAVVRSKMMSRIRSRHTKPELLVRRGLWAMGFRYRLHGPGLPGRPDLVLPKWRTVVFVNGCFWHAHAGCRLFKVPDTRREFWVAKLEDNRRRDATSVSGLVDGGWKVVTVWECALRADPDTAIEKTARVIREATTGSWHVEGHGATSPGNPITISRR